MKNGPTLILFILIVLPLSCSDVTDPPGHSRDQRVILNSYSVQRAAEDFAAENDGGYPIDLRHRSPAGNTLIDLLPEGAFLENPFTNDLDVPREITATYPGETAYRAVGEDHMNPIGYRVTGFGAADRIITLSNLPDSVFEDDEKVIENSFIVRDAVEAFAAENDGRYPNNIRESSLAGNTLIDLLPEGAYLENPFTHELDVPRKMTAVYQGETAYRAVVEEYMTPTGYRITGFGAEGRVISLSNLPESVFEKDEKVIENCLIVRDALEAYRSDSIGRYPWNLADRNLLGLTLIDYLPNGENLSNPYTTHPTEPVDGAPIASGSTGYTAMGGPAGATGYLIEAMGQYYYNDFIIQILKPSDEWQNDGS